MSADISDWLPPQPNTAEGSERRAGIEIELAGLEPEVLTEQVMVAFGGHVERYSGFEFAVVESDLGKFKIEMDASYLKALGAALEDLELAWEEDSIETVATEWITRAAEQFVPWELVTPPIPFSQLHRLNSMMKGLREAGALGTRNSIRYGFGLHINPELPSLDIDTVLAYFRAYLCLYDWLADRDQIDITRKLTNYIKHFSKDYILKVVNLEYQPDMDQFIDDYLIANPTRNRSMDLLPLFAWIDEERVRAKITDDRVKGRPTLHYRLPNCDIDNPQWNLDNPWMNWLQVEKLVSRKDRLEEVCQSYEQYLHGFMATYDNEWLKQTRQWIQVN